MRYAVKHVTASVDISVGCFLSCHGECRYICGMFFVMSRRVSIYLWDVFCHVTVSVDISVGCFLSYHGECRYICGMFFVISRRVLIYLWDVFVT